MVILIENFENLKQNRIFFQLEKSEIGIFQNSIILFHLNFIWENFEQHLFWKKSDSYKLWFWSKISKIWHKIGFFSNWKNRKSEFSKIK